MVYGLVSHHSLEKALPRILGRNAVFDLKMLREEREEEVELAISAKLASPTNGGDKLNGSLPATAINGSNDYHADGGEQTAFAIDSPQSPEAESALSAYSSGLTNSLANFPKISGSTLSPP